MEEVLFWFGGRVSTSSMYTIVPKPVDKGFLMLSPIIKIDKLPHILHKLSQAGISVLDCQKVDFKKL